MTCGWWIHNISVADKTVFFYISISGESWSIVLRDIIGNVEASKSGYSYDNHSLTATTYGMHTLELNCDWKPSSENPCEICSVDIPEICTQLSCTLTII